MHFYFCVTEFYLTFFICFCSYSLLEKQRIHFMFAVRFRTNQKIVAGYFGYVLKCLFVLVNVTLLSTVKDACQRHHYIWVIFFSLFIKTLLISFAPRLIYHSFCLIFFNRVAFAVKRCAKPFIIRRFVIQYGYGMKQIFFSADGEICSLILNDLYQCFGNISMHAEIQFPSST